MTERRLGALVLSFGERLLPRAASAFIMLLLAITASPSEVGIYALAVAVLLIFQSLTDAPVRQIALRAIRTSEGRALLRSYQRLSIGLGSVLLPSGLLAITAFAAETPSANDFVELLPLTVVPVAAAARCFRLAELEQAGAWRFLTRTQFRATFGSLLITVPVLLLTGSVGAASLQLAMSEGIFTTLVLRGRAQPSFANGSEMGAPQQLKREFRTLAFYSFLSIGQGQGERLIMATIASPATLGYYAFAQSVARSTGDAMSMATTGVLRAEVAPLKQASDIRRASEPVVKRALLLATVIAILTVVGTEAVLRPLLPELWDPALDTVRILSLTVAPTMLSWCLTVALVASGRLGRATPVKVLGAASSIPVALLATISLHAVAWGVVAREMVLFVALSLVARPVAPFLAYRFLPLSIALSFGTIVLAEALERLH